MNKLTVVEMEDIRGMRLRKFKLRKIVLGVRMHFHHTAPTVWNALPSQLRSSSIGRGHWTV